MSVLTEGQVEVFDVTFARDEPLGIDLLEDENGFVKVFTRWLIST